MVSVCLSTSAWRLLVLDGKKFQAYGVASTFHPAARSGQQAHILKNRYTIGNPDASMHGQRAASVHKIWYLLLAQSFFHWLDKGGQISIRYHAKWVVGTNDYGKRWLILGPDAVLLSALTPYPGDVRPKAVYAWLCLFWSPWTILI